MQNRSEQEWFEGQLRELIMKSGSAIELIEQRLQVTLAEDDPNTAQLMNWVSNILKDTERCLALALNELNHKDG